MVYYSLKVDSIYVWIRVEIYILDKCSKMDILFAGKMHIGMPWRTPVVVQVHFSLLS